MFYRLVNERHDCKTASVKGVSKLSLIFFCVYSGFVQTGNICDPYYVAQIVSLPTKNVKKALDMYTFPGCTILEPEDAIIFYIHNINHYFQYVGMRFDFESFKQQVYQ